MWLVVVAWQQDVQLLQVSRALKIAAVCKGMGWSWHQGMHPLLGCVVQMRLCMQGRWSGLKMKSESPQGTMHGCTV